jgi:SET domain-containing protein
MPPKRIILDDKLYVQRSGIEKAGKGLFARKRIPKGACIGKYLGDVVTDLTACDKDYIIETMPYFDMNGKEIGPKMLCGKRMDNKMRWINDPRYDRSKINAVTIQTYLGEVEVRAKREIKPAEEIFMSYGEHYWKEEEAKRLRMWLDY